MDDPDKVLEYGEILVDKGAEIKADMSLDKSEDHLYVITKNKVKILACAFINFSI